MGPVEWENSRNRIEALNFMPHDILSDMAGHAALPPSMEQEIKWQRYMNIVTFLLHNKSELE